MECKGLVEFFGLPRGPIHTTGPSSTMVVYMDVKRRVCTNRPSPKTPNPEGPTPYKLKNPKP